VEVLAFGPRGEVLVTGGSGSSMRFWALPELEELRSVELGGVGSWGRVRDGRLLTFTRMDDVGRQVLRRMWSLPEGELELQGGSSWAQPFDVDPSGGVVAQGRGRKVLVSPLGATGGSSERILGEAGDDVQYVALAPGGDRVASLDRFGEIRVWSTTEVDADPLHAFQGPRYEGFGPPRFDPTGRYVTQAGPNSSFLLWDLESPPGTEPRVVRRSLSDGFSSCAFDPAGHWAVTDFEEGTIELWPLEAPWARTFPAPRSTVWRMAFTDDSRSLATCPLQEPARLWPLNAAYGSSRDLVPAEPCASLATHPARDDILVGTSDGDLLLCPIAGGSPRRLPGGFGGTAQAVSVAFDPEGRRAVAAPYAEGRSFADPTERVLRVWDLESGRERVISVAHLTDADWSSADVGFAHDGSLYATLGKGGRVMRLTLPHEPDGETSGETVVDAGSAGLTLSRDGRFLVVNAGGTEGSDNFFRREQLLLFDLVEGTSRRITSHGARLTQGARLDPTGRIIVTGDIDGVVRAGPATGEEPHLLIGHKGMITSLAISPDSRWIASADDESVRLWPMPDVTRPPLHTLPHDELLAKLDALTNLRAVRDPDSSTGWSFEVGPFPGWAAVPEWNP
jgi:WD40 repeat protein